VNPEWFRELLNSFTHLFPDRTFLNLDFNVMGLAAVILVSLVCGAVGSMVVGNRMAFFSDALAHCAFTGVAMGLLIGLASGLMGNANQKDDSAIYREYGIPFIMVGFGVLIGLGIAFVRDKTSLANDSVIGVFFAGAMGFGAMILKVISQRNSSFNAENFLFGNPTLLGFYDLVILLSLAVLTGVVLMLLFNQLVFSSFNTSLGRSRRLHVRLCSYLFIVLLALIVNLCYKTVGALLIHSLLIVPAATASNLARNMRQLFWMTMGLCLLSGVLGLWFSFEVSTFFQTAGTSETQVRSRAPIGPSGTIVCLSVVFFFLSMAWSSVKARLARRPSTVN
jgi:zinc transport system permease protein